MSKQDSLDELLKKLESDSMDTVDLLQQIGEKILTEYVIQVQDVIVEPIWIEAYYYNERRGFKDPFVHRDERQKKMDVLYFHHKTDDQRNGVDICLSPEDKDFYCSFLLKYSLVDGALRSQSQLSPLIREKYTEDSPVLVPRTRSSDIIACTKRIGLKINSKDPLKAEKERYKDLELAVVRDFDKDFESISKLPSRESLTRNYLVKMKSSDEEWKKKSREILGYCMSKKNK